MQIWNEQNKLHTQLLRSLDMLFTQVNKMIFKSNIEILKSKPIDCFVPMHFSPASETKFSSQSLRSVNIGHGTLLTLGSTCEFKNNAIRSAQRPKIEILCMISRDSMLLVFFALALRIFAIYALGPFMQMAYLSIKSWNSGAMNPLGNFLKFFFLLHWFGKG